MQLKMNNTLEEFKSTNKELFDQFFDKLKRGVDVPPLTIEEIDFICVALTLRFKHTSYDYITIIEKTCEIFNINVQFKSNQLNRDMAQYCMKHVELWTKNISERYDLVKCHFYDGNVSCSYAIDDAHHRFVDRVKDVTNRMTIRLELLNLGISKGYIEKKIMKIYNLKSYTEESINNYDDILSNICHIEGFEYEKKENKGRLKIPDSMIKIPQRVKDFMKKNMTL